jgi:L-ascorbate metabolism protein UlaG (beta-lactamase superfamily)
MPIYIAVPLSADTSALDSAVEQRISSSADRYKLQTNSGWLIKFDGTTVELSNKIGVTGQEKGVAPLGSVIFVPVSGYYGRGPNDMWEWLKTRLER